MPFIISWSRVTFESQKKPRKKTWKASRAPGNALFSFIHSLYYILWSQFTGWNLDIFKLPSYLFSLQLYTEMNWLLSVLFPVWKDQESDWSISGRLFSLSPISNSLGVGSYVNVFWMHTLMKLRTFWEKATACRFNRYWKGRLACLDNIIMMIMIISSSYWGPACLCTLLGGSHPLVYEIIVIPWGHIISPILWFLRLLLGEVK